MSRPTTVEHPLASLRRHADLGRQQLAAHLQSRGLKFSPALLEKLERGERTFTDLHHRRLFEATGICPGWLANPDGPIHTADGHPYTPGEFERWIQWGDLAPTESPGPGTGTLSYGGRALGPHYRQGCCPAAHDLLNHGPLAAPDLPEQQLKAAQRQSRQLGLAAKRARVVDLARGAAMTVTQIEDEDTLLKLMAAIRRVVPSARPRQSPEDEALQREHDLLWESLATKPPSSAAKPSSHPTTGKAPAPARPRPRSKRPK